MAKAGKCFNYGVQKSSKTKKPPRKIRNGFDFFKCCGLLYLFVKLDMRFGSDLYQHFVSIFFQINKISSFISIGV